MFSSLFSFFCYDISIESTIQCMRHDDDDDDDDDAFLSRQKLNLKRG